MRYTQNIIATFCPRLKFIRVDSAADGGYSSEGGEPMLWAPKRPDEDIKLFSDMGFLFRGRLRP